MAFVAADGQIAVVGIVEEPAHAAVVAVADDADRRTMAVFVLGYEKEDGSEKLWGLVFCDAASTLVDQAPLHRKHHFLRNRRFSWAPPPQFHDGQSGRTVSSQDLGLLFVDRKNKKIEQA